jgi:hypothetical protein
MASFFLFVFYRHASCDFATIKSAEKFKKEVKYSAKYPIYIAKDRKSRETDIPAI